MVDIQFDPVPTVLTAANASTASQDGTQTGTHYFDGRFLRGVDLISEPTVVDQQAGTTAYKVVVDPIPSVAEERQVDTGTDSSHSNTNNYFTNDYSLTVSAAASANLNAFAGQTVRLRIALGDVNGDKIDDIIVGAGPGAGPHIKVIDGTRSEQERAVTISGSPTGSFALTFQGDRLDPASPAKVYSTVSGKVTAVAIDESDPASSVYSHPDLYQNIWLNQSELESIIDDLARDLASRTGQINDAALLASFFAFPGFTGGVSVDADDVNGDRIDDIIVGAGPGSSAHVK